MMKKRDYVIVAIVVAMSLSPIVGASMWPVMFASLMAALGVLFYLMYGHSKRETERDAEIVRVREEIKQANAERDDALSRAAELDKFFEENGYGDLAANRERIEQENAAFKKDVERQCEEYERQLAEANAQQEKVLQEKTALVMKLTEEAKALEDRSARAAAMVGRTEEAERKYGQVQVKLQRAKMNLDIIEHSIANWLHLSEKPLEIVRAEAAVDNQNALDPIAELDLKAMTIADLRKEAKRIGQAIDSLCDEFSMKFQQKAYRSLFATVVLYLKLEIRCIMEELRYKEQDEAIKKVRHLMFRVQDLLEDGNKTILPTAVAFLGEMEKLGIDAVKVEYLWYLRKEQQKQEQAAIRERMREEREERIRMEEERKRIAEEEKKYAAEMERLRQKLEEEKRRAAEAAALSGEAIAEPSEAQKDIEAQMLKVEASLGEMAVQKEEIAKLQNGRAGTVYVISNLGSFGDDVFKVGMTRRLDPQDRVDELGDASVPFEFDVHCFIFSEDASGLETALHQRLAEMRVNKVNSRKEFFRVSLDDIERIVQETDPTAEFNRTMLAEEFRASQSGVVLNDLPSDSNAEGDDSREAGDDAQ